MQGEAEFVTSPNTSKPIKWLMGLLEPTIFINFNIVFENKILLKFKE